MSISNPIDIIWHGSASDTVGYSSITQNYLKAINTCPRINVQLINMSPFTPSTYLCKQDAELILQLMNHNISHPNFCIINNIAGDFRVFHPHSYNNIIYICLFETDRIPLHWVIPLNMCYKVWVPSYFNYQTFHNSGIDKSKLDIIPYCLDTNLYKPHTNAKRFYSDFTFYYNAQFSYRKGFDWLIASFKKAFPNNTDVHLVCKTDATVSDTQLLRQWIGQDSRILLLTGRHATCEQQVLTLNGIDCYVSASRAEGWDFPAMEAMACKKPVIAVDTGGHKVFMNNSNALLIPTQGKEPVDMQLQRARPAIYGGHYWDALSNSDDLVDQLRYAYNEPTKCEAIAQQGYKTITEQFSTVSIGSIIQNTLDKYINIIN